MPIDNVMVEQQLRKFGIVDRMLCFLQEPKRTDAGHATLLRIGYPQCFDTFRHVFLFYYIAAFLGAALFGFKVDKLMTIV